jgi:succinate-semialdehyde dehydrogenase/glutarate-semialdehyde dehydrogenase
MENTAITGSAALAYPDVQLLIDNVWRPASSGLRSPVHNPATGQQIGSFAHAGEVDIGLVLEASARGFEVWKKVSAFERCKLMRQAASLLRERVETIATLLTIEQGKPIVEARTETLACADLIDWFAEEGRRAYGRIIPPRGPAIRQSVTKEPVGPVAAFTPWNFPISQLTRKLAAALAAGCSIVIKAAEETPASPAALIQTFLDAGLPPGVIGLLLGTPSEISSRLIAHPTIRKVTFTGSTPVGKQLASLAGLHMKKTTMELGGHAPVFIMKDADLNRAASVMAASKFRNAGQVCVAPTRFLVEQPVYEEFVDLFAKAAGSIKVGNGLDPQTGMGPLANGRRLEAVQSLVQDATQRGARLIAGGKRIGNEGHFFEPTVLADVPVEARAMNEEPFGPVALLVPMESLDDMLDEAARLDFGLAAYGFTRSAASAARIADEVASGMLSMNHAGLALPEVPFGGVNDSGYGTEGGADALESYLNTKFVTHLQVD